MAEEFLSCTLDCHPHAEEPDACVPLVNVHLCEENWFTDLVPEDLTRPAATFRWAADRLDREIGPALVDAREDRAGHVDAGRQSPPAGDPAFGERWPSRWSGAP